MAAVGVDEQLGLAACGVGLVSKGLGRLQARWASGGFSGGACQKHEEGASLGGFAKLGSRNTPAPRHRHWPWRPCDRPAGSLAGTAACAPAPCPPPTPTHPHLGVAEALHVVQLAKVQLDGHLDVLGLAEVGLRGAGALRVLDRALSWASVGGQPEVGGGHLGRAGCRLTTPPTTAHKVFTLSHPQPHTPTPGMP